MGRRLVVVILIAVLIAGGVFYFAQMVQQSRPVTPSQGPIGGTDTIAAPRPVEDGQILVAAKDLPAGTLIQANSLIFRAWPRSGIDQTAYVAQGAGTIDEFEGAVVRGGMRAGEPVVRTNLIKRGESGFMAAVLQPGMRAVSFQVNENTGVAGFVFPGDKVDLVLSHIVNLSDANGQTRSHHISETVLHDVRIIGIDQRAGDQEQTPAVGNVVTVEVSPEDAEKIALAQRIGELRLLLRPLAKSEEEGGEGMLELPGEDKRTFTMDSDLSQIIAPPGGTGVDNGKVAVVQVVRGSASVDAQTK